MSTWWVLRNVFPGPAVRVCLGPVIEGRERVPDGAALVVSNHLSRIDPGFLQLALNRQLTFAVNVRFFQRAGLSGAVARRFLRACAAVPVDARDHRAGSRLVDAAAETFAAGGLFCVYPEGGLARDGLVHRGHSGVGRIVASTGAVVVPVAMLNTDRVAPPVRRRPTLERVRIRIGEALDLRGLVRGPDDPDGARAVTDRIMRAIAILSGREYRDEYLHR